MEDKYQLQHRCTIGSRLKSLRLKYSEHKVTVSEIIGKSLRTIEDYENDVRLPSIDVLEKYAKHYGVTMEYIVRGDSNGKS